MGGFKYAFITALLMHIVHFLRKEVKYVWQSNFDYTVWGKNLLVTVT